MRRKLLLIGILLISFCSASNPPTESVYILDATWHGIAIPDAHIVQEVTAPYTEDDL